MQSYAFRETQPRYKIYSTYLPHNTLEGSCGILNQNQTDDGIPHEIAQTAEEKDLGVTMDDKMIFSRHIQIQVNKDNSAVGMIRHTFNHLDKESVPYLYKSLVRPHLEYDSVIWSPQIKKETSRQHRESAK